MNEKQSIERATGEAFVKLYNELHQTSYRITEFGDAPDIRCQDERGVRLNVEITLTEDGHGDIQASLGRSTKRDAETLRRELADGRGQAPSLERDVVPILIERIKSKLNKQYGTGTALVVRDTSGVDWSWDSAVPDVQQALQGIPNPFDRGIYIVSRSKERLVQLA